MLIVQKITAICGRKDYDIVRRSVVYRDDENKQDLVIAIIRNYMYFGTN